MNFTVFSSAKDSLYLKALNYHFAFSTNLSPPIAYISEGRGIHYVGGDQILVEPGDLFVIAIGTPHVFRPLSIEEDRRILVYNCIFERNYINRFLDVLPDVLAIEQLFHLTEVDRFNTHSSSPHLLDVKQQG
jgi:hypothetical protein